MLDYTLQLDGERWHRREWTTKGSDPTVVVEWKHGDLTITQFQDVIVVDDAHKRMESEIDFRAAYNTLEEIYERTLGPDDMSDLDVEVAEAEAAAGWDPNA